MQRERYIIG